MSYSFALLLFFGALLVHSEGSNDCELTKKKIEAKRQGLDEAIAEAQKRVAELQQEKKEFIDSLKELVNGENTGTTTSRK